MKVAFCSSEVFPFAKTGGLADVSSDLPQALERLGIEPVIFLPYYRCIEEGKFAIQRINSRLSQTTLGRGIPVYLIENDAFFNRQGLYGDEHGDYSDNLERFQYFCEQVLEQLKQLRLRAEIIHCHDWHTALIPVYLKEKLAKDPFLKNMKSVLTIHNLAYQGIFPKQKFSPLGLRPGLFSMEGFEFFGQINLLKAGIIFADQLTTVSRQYAKEILTKEFGCGLEGVLKNREKNLMGILNGVDTQYWNPQTDPYLETKYSKENFLKGKQENKKKLQKHFNLSSAEVPLFGFVARLAGQKGVDLILKSSEELLKKDIQIVSQGVGEKKYIEALKALAYDYPQRIAIHLKFDEAIAHQIYAGSDFFLVPSIFEPCGLGQMISMRYGTIPIGFKTGGLVDTISPFHGPLSQGNGFLFEQYRPEAFLKTIDSALTIYRKKDQWRKLIENAFCSDFPWEQSAKQYLKIYERLSKMPNQKAKGA